jgi:hypothetical protein
MESNSEKKYGRIIIRTAKLSDIHDLAPRLREADIQEIKAASGETSVGVLERGLFSSDPCYVVVRDDGRSLALFGVVPDLSSNFVSSGIIWLLGSDDLVKYSYTFLRYGREWIERLQERYNFLWNYVDARNETHIRWLKWCGFSFYAILEKHGVEQRPFYKFGKQRETCEAALDSSVVIPTVGMKIVSADDAKVQEFRRLQK